MHHRSEQLSGEWHRWMAGLWMLFVHFFAIAQSPHGNSLKVDCSACHVPNSWTTLADPIGFDHDTTSLPLTGVHGRIDCRSCHASLVFEEPIGTTCISCHVDVHEMTLGDDCARCHSSNSWLVDEIPELHEQNGFPLIGVHSALSCVDCHAPGNTLAFARIGNECINCHQDEYMTTTSPNHLVSGFSKDCLECHDPMGQGWGAQFTDHDFFPLTNGHAINDCSRCHTTGNFADASPVCSSCHMTEYTASSDPDHGAAGFSTDCAACHNTGPGWSGSFDHNNTAFPLHGAHTTTACIECHANGYAGTPTACNACHMEDYNSTTDPNHQTSGFSTDCAMCHDESAWGNATFDHNNTDFPLHGAHTSTACIECHANGYAGTPTACNACHMDDYNSTTDPNHQTSAFSTDCALCHDETAWGNATFDHNNTDFPLHGAHTSTACIECHANGYAGTPTACNACHMDDYNATTQPNHQTSGFSTDCAICHDETAWGNGSFDHNNTAFPLHGAHTTTACIECHANGYAGTPTACSACHMNDYNGTTDPNHQSSGFGTDCAMCHDETAWGNGTFDHDQDYFPIYSGNHNGEWNACTDCHTNASDYSVFTCIDCHEHDNQSQVNNDHNEVSGYSYNSNACYNCHPNGN